MSSDWARQRFASARVARLATVDAEFRPHLVPVVFAVHGDSIVSAVDRKPKRDVRLRRLDNIRGNAAVSLLVDDYSDDWEQLWWARADGTARIVAAEDDETAPALAALAARYVQYAEAPPPGPVIIVMVVRWSGWAARG